MMQAAFDLQAEPIAVYLNGGRVQRPTVPLASAYGDPPYGIYPTADGFLALSDSPLKDVIGAMGRPDSLRAFEDVESIANRSEDIYRALAAVSVGKSTSEWVGQLRAEGIWCAPAISYDEVMEDPLVKAVDPVAEVSHPRAGKIRIVRHPISYSSGAAVINWVGPTVGEHSNEILRGLNYSDADISSLKKQGIV